MVDFIKKYSLSLTLGLWIVVSLLSLIPLPELPSLPGKDKTMHIISYHMCVFPVSIGRPKYWYLWVLGILMWSGVMEMIQPYVNRYGEWSDLGANSLGVGLGVLTGTFFRRLLHLYDSRRRSDNP